MVKRTTKTKARSQSKQHNSRRFRNYAMMFVCATVLVCGFFFAGRQHFSSMDYGMKNSRLRKQIDELESEKRRLMLAREVSLSPAEIKKAAKKSGMTDQYSLEGEVAQVASATKEKAVPTKVSDAKSLVVKTAAVSAAPERIAANYRKPDKTVKSVKAVAISAE